MDDEPAIVEGLAEMIESYEMPFKEIRMAYSGKQALKLSAESFGFDIVLADIRMPNMSGLQFFEKLKEFRPRTKVIFLTGYSEFEYARSAMKLGANDYLLKPAEDEEVITSLQKTIAELEMEREQRLALSQVEKQRIESFVAVQNEMFHQLSIARKEERLTMLSKHFDNYSIPFQLDVDVVIALFRIDDWEERFKPKDESLIQFAVQNMLNDILGKISLLLSYRYDESTVALVFQARLQEDTNNFSTSVRESLMEAQESIYRILGVIVTFALSPTWVTWSYLPDDFKKLATYMKQFLGKGRLLISGISMPVTDVRISEFNHSITEVISAINSCDVSLFSDYLNKIFATDVTSQPNSLPLLFTTITSQIMNLALQHHAQHILDSERLEKMTNLYMHKNAEEMKIFLVETLEELKNLITVQEKNPSKALVKQIKTYVRQNLEGDLSLQAISRIVHVNPSYLSRLFSQQANERLSEYISRIKMEHARDLLIKGDGKINEIATQIGFYNANYFAKVFRKAYGISPQDFRSNNR